MNLSLSPCLSRADCFIAFSQLFHRRSSPLARQWMTDRKTRFVIGNQERKPVSIFNIVLMVAYHQPQTIPGRCGSWNLPISGVSLLIWLFEASDENFLSAGSYVVSAHRHSVRLAALTGAYYRWQDGLMLRHLFVFLTDKRIGDLSKNKSNHNIKFLIKHERKRKRKTALFKNK